MSNHAFTGRTRPYTDIGIRRIPCSRCGAPSTQQWQVCSNGNRYIGICDACDLALNKLVLEFMRVPNREVLLKVYEMEMATQ